MNFVYEDISKEDFEKFGIGALAEKYGEKSFRKWSVNETKDVYLIRIPDTFGNLNNPDYMVDSYIMNIRGLWVEFEAKILEHGGEYKGETWSKYGITKAVPYVRDATGRRQNLSKGELPIAYEAVISAFCEAFTAENCWMNNRSIRHEVFFEDLTTNEV